MDESDWIEVNTKSKQQQKRQEKKKQNIQAKQIHVEKIEKQSMCLNQSFPRSLL
jgi:hypothetical protein